MEIPFSDVKVDRNYRGPNVINLTHIDDVPPAIDWVTNELLHGDDELPDAMVVDFDKDQLRD